MTQLKIWLSIFLLMARSALAGSLTAEIDKKRSNLEEPFWVTVTVQGSLDQDVSVPATDDFEIMRTGESTNISIVNGSMTKERQYTYQVRALKEGALTIPSFKAKVDDEEVQTPPITVEVKGGVAAPSQNDVATNKKLVVVERELPKTTLFEGEVIISKVRLLTRARLTGATPARDAAPDWRMFPVDGQRNTEVTREGVRWNAIEMSEGLIPLRAGKLKVPPFGINASWIQPTQRRNQPRSIFDMLQGGMMGMGEEVSRKLQSNQVSITVKPLPAPKPADFSDMVGAFTISSNVSKRSLSVGETATVTIEVKGQGALDRMRDIKLNVAGARVYDDKPSLSEKIEPGAGLVSTRVFKFAVVPNASGPIELGTVKLSSFNPFTESYDGISTALGTINVAGAGQTGSPAVSGTVPSAAAPSSQGVTQNQVSSAPATDQPKTPDLSPRVVGDGDSAGKRPWFLGPVALAIEVLLLVVLVSLIVLRRSWHKLKSSSPSRKDAQVRQNLSSIIEELDQSHPEVVERALRALKEALADQGQDPLALTPRDLIRNAEQMKFDLSQVEALRRILTEIDRRAYSGESTEILETSFLADLRNLLTYCQARNV